MQMEDPGIQSQANCLLYSSALKALEVIEDSPPEAFFNCMLVRYGLSEKELLPKYALFEKALYDILGNNADIIRQIIRKEIIRMSRNKHNDPAVNELKNIIK